MWNKPFFKNNSALIQSKYAKLRRKKKQLAGRNFSIYQFYFFSIGFYQMFI